MNQEEYQPEEKLQDFCESVEQFQEQLHQYIDKYKEIKGNENGQNTEQLEQNIGQISEKVKALRRSSSGEEIHQLVGEIRNIVHSTSNDSLNNIFNEDFPFEFDFEQPKIRNKEVKSAQERKQERKRARLLKSKQAIQVFKKYVILFLIGLQKFIRDPENIAKLFVIAVTCFFVSSFLQIPDMSNRHSLYILEWLAYNRSSRTVLISGSFCFVSLTWYVIFLAWIALMGMQESKGKLTTLIHECNPILQLTLLFMTDSDLINNKFDLSVWFCYIFQFATYKVYYLHSMQIYKKVLSSLTAQNLNQLQTFQQIKIFASIILIFNILITFFGILMLHKVGIYAISLLFFGGLTTLIEYTKLILICQKIKTKYSYFINNNIDQLTEPQFYQELIPDVIYHILKIAYCMQLIINYFLTINFQIFLHLWLFYIFSDLQVSLQALKVSLDHLIRYKKIQHNIDSLFPRITNIEHDEICSICHEDLLIARSLPCNHKFHLKCLFNWLKAQQLCPMCRAEVPIQLDQPQFMLTRFFNLLSSINLSNVTFLFTINNRINAIPQGGQFQQWDDRLFQDQRNQRQEQPQQQPQQQSSFQQQLQNSNQQQLLTFQQRQQQFLEQRQQLKQEIKQTNTNQLQQQQYQEKQQYIDAQQPVKIVDEEEDEDDIDHWNLDFDEQKQIIEAIRQNNIDNQEFIEELQNRQDIQSEQNSEEQFVEDRNNEYQQQ